MESTHSDLKRLIAARVAAQPGAVWTPVDFLDLGARDAVDKALQRLVAAELLRRIDRGLYDSPRFNPLTQKPTAPDYRRIIDAMGRRDQIRMLVDGMTAANDLGLSDAVPGRIVVHVDARLRPVHIGKQTITFRPTSPSKLFWAGRRAMRFVQALHWLRPALGWAEEGLRLRRRLRVILDAGEEGKAIVNDLRQGLTALPTWMQEVVHELLGERDGQSETTPRHGAAAVHHHHHRQKPDPHEDREPTKSSAATEQRRRSRRSRLVADRREGPG